MRLKFKEDIAYFTPNIFMEVDDSSQKSNEALMDKM